MTWWRRLLAQLGGRTPAGRDTVVAGLLAVAVSTALRSSAASPPHS